MTDRVILHIGAPKTGTTYLQAVLSNNREALAGNGIWYVGEHWRDHVHARLALIEHPRLKRLDPTVRRGWDRAVAEAMEWTGHTAIMSHELFGSATQEQAKQAIADLAPAEVHLVFTTRDYADQVMAVWQEALKWRNTTPLSRWRPLEEDAGPHSDWSWRTMDPVGVLKRWQGELDPHRIHVVTVPRPGGPPEELWNRFAQACGIGPGDYQLEVKRSNRSIGAAEAELLRRVNLKLDSTFSLPEISRWLRGYLAHDVLVPRKGEPLTLPADEVEELTTRAKAAVSWLTESGFDVVGDLADIVPSSPRPLGLDPDDVDDSALLDIATDTIATMLLTVKERTEERDAARAKLKDVRTTAGKLRSRIGAAKPPSERRTPVGRISRARSLAGAAKRRGVALVRSAAGRRR